MIVERRENIQRKRENKKEDLKWVFDIGRKETLKSQNRFFACGD